jgi:hypothetical protein
VHPALRPTLAPDAYNITINCSSMGVTIANGRFTVEYTLAIMSDLVRRTANQIREVQFYSALEKALDS